jgi:hypothetical protein
VRLYIAGPMSGYDNKNLHWFNWAQDRLHLLGYETLNPASVEGDGTATWQWYMREGLEMLLQADGVAVLDDWECSAGARLEVQVAQALMIPVKPVLRWSHVGA